MWMYKINWSAWLPAGLLTGKSPVHWSDKPTYELCVPDFVLTMTSICVKKYVCKGVLQYWTAKIIHNMLLSCACTSWTTLYWCTEHLTCAGWSSDLCTRSGSGKLISSEMCLCSSCSLRWYLRSQVMNMPSLMDRLLMCYCFTCVSVYGLEPGKT